MTLIQLTTVTKTYRGRRGTVTALDSVDLSVNEGEFVAVKGPSGSGKSTLLLTVGGMVRPSDGRVIVRGSDVYALSSQGRARLRAQSIGFVFQMFHLVPYLSVLENVLLPTRLLRRPGASEEATALLTRFGMADRLAHRPGELSTGERQRAAMARALVNHPTLLLADEPTGNLDPENADRIFGYLTEFHRGGGTVVVVSHDAACEQHATRTIHLREGALVPPTA